MKEWSRRLQDFTQLVEALCIKVDITDHPQFPDQAADTIQHWGRSNETSGTETTVAGAVSPTRDRDVAAIRQDPQRPPTRRAVPASSPGIETWEFIDILNMDQCMHMPDGLQTVEFSPNSLQEEWTDAWNCVHRSRAAAVPKEDKDIALKLPLWLPQ